MESDRIVGETESLRRVKVDGATYRRPTLREMFAILERLGRDEPFAPFEMPRVIAGELWIPE